MSCSTLQTSCLKLILLGKSNEVLMICVDVGQLNVNQQQHLRHKEQLLLINSEVKLDHYWNRLKLL